MSRRLQWACALTVLVAAAVAGSYVAAPLLRGQTPPAGAAGLCDPVSFRAVAKQVLPAVVSIETHAKAVKAKPQAGQQRRRPVLPDNVPDEFRRFFEGMEGFEFQMPEQAPQAPHQGFGSGFIVDPKGVILTNHHVVAGADEVEVQLMDGRKFTSKDIKSDPKTDLAIVRIDAKGALPYLELGDSDAMEIGDRVLTAGAPFGLKGSMSAGIVSAKGRNGLHMNMYEDYIQTDAAINPGNSGGPLVNLEGKVVGINSMIKTQSGGFQGVGLAISSNLAKTIMTQLQEHGTVKRGYLGIQIRDLNDPEVAARLGVKDQGVLVAQVFEKAPAANAGIQAGDVITAIGGKPVKEGKDLQRLVAGLPLGKAVNVTILRDGKEKVLPVTIEEQPQEFGTVKAPKLPTQRRETPTTSLDKIGVEVADLTPELADQLGYKEQAKGAVVTQVEPGSLAQQAGVRRGVLITKVEKEPVKSAAELKEALDKAALEKGVLFQVESPQGGVGYIMMKGEPTAAN
jgi:serine protease Do